MHRHYALAGPGRARDPCRSVEVSLHRTALGGMQEDQPFFPRSFQRLNERCFVGGDPEPSLRIGVSERVGCGSLQRRPGNRALADREGKQRLLRFLREPIEDCEQIIVAGEPTHRLEIDGRDAEAQEVIIALCGEDWRHRVGLRARGRLLLGAHNLLKLNDLRGAGNRMRCDRPAFGPAICCIMMIDIHQDVPIAVAKDNDAQIHIRAD